MQYEQGWIDRQFFNYEVLGTIAPFGVLDCNNEERGSAGMDGSVEFFFPLYSFC